MLVKNMACRWQVGIHQWCPTLLLEGYCSFSSGLLTTSVYTFFSSTDGKNKPDESIDIH